MSARILLSALAMSLVSVGLSAQTWCDHLYDLDDTRAYPFTTSAGGAQVHVEYVSFQQEGTAAFFYVTCGSELWETQGYDRLRSLDIAIAANRDCSVQVHDFDASASGYDFCVNLQTAPNTTERSGTDLRQVTPGDDREYEILVENDSQLRTTIMWNRANASLQTSVSCDDGQGGARDFGSAVAQQDRLVRLDVGIRGWIGQTCRVRVSTDKTCVFALNWQLYQDHLLSILSVEE